ncbi:hypothetical protein BDF14DRAFT_1793401 [Spinellus fusiger]|nr:hypothetical protein BDF14DRAFT_1793401 [Spinellus fusiger]
MADSSLVTSVTATQGIKKPNEEAYKKQLEEMNARIEKLKAESEAVKEKISKLPGKTENTRKEEIKETLNGLRSKQADIKNGKKAVYEQMNAVQDSIRKKVGTIKAFQAKVPYKNIAEVDERIIELETKIESGVRLVEEKKMLQEISLLKRSRSQVEDLDKQQAVIDREKVIYTELKQKIDDGDAKKYSEQFETHNNEYKKIVEEEIKLRDSHNKLRDERTRLRGLLDEEFNALRTLRDEHRKANDEYYTFIRQFREQKRAQERQRKLQAEADQRKELAEQELELASMPAFSSEIALCDNLAKYLSGFVSSGNATEGEVAAVAATPINVPQGMVVLKKTDVEEGYFMGGGKKKGAKGISGPKAPTAAKKSDALKLPLTTLEDFFTIKVTVPTKISEVAATLEKLKEKKEYYLNEQPKATENNRQKAIAKIAAMEKEEEERLAQEAAEKKAAQEEKVAEVTETEKE